MTPLFNDTALLPLLLVLIVLSVVGWIRIPLIAGLARLGQLAAVALILILATGQRDRFEPHIGRLLAPLERDAQRVVGEEVRLKMSPDGHFWADVRLNGVKRRMLVDSGATVTAVSEETAAAVGLQPGQTPVPILIRTANGTVAARSGEVEELRLGNIKAGGLGVVVSPAFGDVDVLGMNFLSKLKSWRVEDGTLILTPNHPQPEVEA